MQQEEQPKMKTEQASKAERMSLDRISTLPQPILEIILCLLPTREVVGTSILSRDWRYKWRKIPKLEFKFSIVRMGCKWESMSMKCKHLYNVHQVLLQHQGPIQDLTIHTCIDGDPFGLDQIIHHLAKNHTLKKLTLHGWDLGFCFNLPISLFSLRHLTDLSLCFVDIEHDPIFNGFGSLRSLVLQDVGISTKTLLHLLSSCPSLKILSLMLGDEHLDGKDCTFIELFKCLPAIEHLTICYDIEKWLILDAGQQELPALLFHLKYFCLKYPCFLDGCGLAFLLLLIKCSPNLEKIQLSIEKYEYHECYGENSVVWKEYSDVWLEHLNELEIEVFSNSEPEMEFVKFILARSPNLKKVKLIRSSVNEKDKLEMLEVLLQAPRASAVRIYV